MSESDQEKPVTTEPTAGISAPSVPTPATPAAKPTVQSAPKQPEVKTVAFNFNEKAFVQQIEQQELYLNQFAGKKGYNPFFQLKAINDMRSDFAKGNRTKELYERAASLKQIPPQVTATEDAPVESAKPALGIGQPK